MSTPLLILPGYGDSGPQHWQSLWERLLPGATRVQQRDWENPALDDWVAALDAAITTCAVAHDWGSRLEDAGRTGHINSASGLGEWPWGQAFLRELL